MASIGLCAQLACIWEATARKPGNVHRHQDFAGLNYLDFLVSAAAIAPVLEIAPCKTVGQTVLDAIRATRTVVSTNTNLGMVLLLAPLAAVPKIDSLRERLGQVLAHLTVGDASLVYQAIRLAVPGGMGRVEEQDLTAEPTQTLRQVMSLAADRDLIARQYANDYAEVLDVGVPALQQGLAELGNLETAIIACYLHLLALYPDSLIARKRGIGEAQEASRRASDVLGAGWPHTSTGMSACRELDEWLRAEGHARNPGTTADLVTACLFVLLRQGTIQTPPQYPWLVETDHD